MNLEAQILELRAENRLIKTMLEQVLSVVNPEGELLTRAEAARILKVNPKTINHIATKYPIRDLSKNGNKCYKRAELLKIKALKKN